MSNAGRKSKLDPERQEKIVSRSESAQTLSSGDREAVLDKLAASLGCRTSEVAFALLGQIVALEHPTTTMEPERIKTLRTKAFAMLMELQPTTATEALLAAQMIGAQRLAMTFLERSTLQGQTVDGADRNILRALRLMHLFTAQVEAMAKLQGKSGQQRVNVEHVTVAAGGQAIVGTVTPGERGLVATIDDEPHAPRRGWLKNGNRPGDWATAPRCGAMARRHTACQCPAMRNRRRCRLHGGKSTGPRTVAGLERSRRARWKHGAFSSETRARLADSRRQWRELWASLTATVRFP